MSRCYPFPPPGYAGKVANNVALIDSIKLHEERENIIPDRVKDKIRSSDKKKDRKKEKKEKKKEQKAAKKDGKSRSAAESEKQKYSDKLHKTDSVGTEHKRSSEVLERSNLTEEYGRPVDSHNAPCSSDSTGNSGKRKKHSSSPASSTIQGNGNIIRIRLSSQKRDEPSTSGSIPTPKSEDLSTSQGKLRPWSRSDSSISRTDVMSKVQAPLNVTSTPAATLQKVQAPLNLLSTSTATLQLVSREDNSHTLQDKKIESLLLPKEHPTTSGRDESKKPPVKKLSSHEKKMLKKESLYNSLFQNLVSPTLESPVVADQDEDDWLRPAKRLRGSDDLQSCMDIDNLSCLASAVLQPRAHFLSDVGVHALPFTVPY